MLFITCDTHLGHENIKKFCNRPDNFESLIEKNWNDTVGKDDTIIHLGDISLNRDAGDSLDKKVGNWNGRKILIRGNHDKKPDSFYMDCGFTAVVSDMSMRFNDIKILFSHRPKFDHDCDINIHGHQHNLAVYDNTRLYLPLSIEHMGYKPLAINDEFINNLKPFILNKKQPTLNEIMKLGQKAIGKPNSKDFYDGFGKEIFVRSQARLKECYKILNSPPYTMSMQRYRLWWYALQYIEDRMSKKDFMNNISGFVNDKINKK